MPIHLYIYNYAPVLPVKVSRPYFLTRPQNAREKFFLEMRLWDEVNNTRWKNIGFCSGLDDTCTHMHIHSPNVGFLSLMCRMHRQRLVWSLLTSQCMACDDSWHMLELVSGPPRDEEDQSCYQPLGEKQTTSEIKHHYLISLSVQGVVIYMLPVEVFA